MLPITGATSLLSLLPSVQQPPSGSAAAPIFPSTAANGGTSSAAPSQASLTADAAALVANLNAFLINQQASTSPASTSSATGATGANAAGQPGSVPDPNSSPGTSASAAVPAAAGHHHHHHHAPSSDATGSNQPDGVSGAASQLQATSALRAYALQAQTTPAIAPSLAA